MVTCRDCRYNRRCMERSRLYPCKDFKLRTYDNDRSKRNELYTDNRQFVKHGENRGGK